QTTLPSAWVDPSLKVPRALNCSQYLTGTLGFEGVMAMEERTADETVSVAVPVTPRIAAETSALPVVRVCTLPAEPGWLEMVAIEESEMVQSTSAVRSCEDPSENEPVAASCHEVPFGSGEGWATEIETSVAGVTLTAAESLKPPSAPLITVLPAAMASARPAASMETIEGSSELQVTSPLTSCTLPSEKNPLAVKR